MSLTLGDRVIVTGGYREREPRRQGVVVAERRKYVAIQIDGLRDAIDFDKQTGYERTGPNDTDHYALRARTPEQVEYDDRVAAAWDTLREAGLGRTYAKPALITDEQLVAIANIVRGTP